MNVVTDGEEEVRWPADLAYCVVMLCRDYGRNREEQIQALESIQRVIIYDESMRPVIFFTFQVISGGLC